jgi:Zn-dependent M16 (insulinase) family peptidase
MRDRLMGYDFYTKIKEFEKNPDSAKALVEKIAALRDKVFSKERLTLSLAGSCDEGFAGEIISLFAKKGDTPPASTLGTLGKENEGIAIPAQVGFAAMSSRLSDVGAVTTGALAVAKTILNFEYLWCEVRVKGGAYGVSFRVTKDGAVGYTSYRDPSPVASLGVFSASSRFLREFLSSERNLTRYIIGAMGEYEPYNSIPAKASLSTSDVLSGSTEEEKERVRREILATDKESLLGVADMLEKLENTLSPVIVAPKEMLSSLETVLYL